MTDEELLAEPRIDVVLLEGRRRRDEADRERFAERVSVALVVALSAAATIAWWLAALP